MCRVLQLDYDFLIGLILTKKRKTNIVSSIKRKRHVLTMYHKFNSLSNRQSITSSLPGSITKEKNLSSFWIEVKHRKERNKPSCGYRMYMRRSVSIFRCYIFQLNHMIRKVSIEFHHSPNVLKSKSYTNQRHMILLW